MPYLSHFHFDSYNLHTDGRPDDFARAQTPSYPSQSLCHACHMRSSAHPLTHQVHERLHKVPLPKHQEAADRITVRGECMRSEHHLNHARINSTGSTVHKPLKGGDLQDREWRGEWYKSVCRFSDSQMSTLSFAFDTSAGESFSWAVCVQDWLQISVQRLVNILQSGSAWWFSAYAWRGRLTDGIA